MKKTLRISAIIVLVILIIIVAIYVVVYYAVAWGWTNVEGEVDRNNYQFEQSYAETINFDQEKASTADTSPMSRLRLQNSCKMALLEKYAPINAALISDVYLATDSDEIESRMIFATGLRLPELAHSFQNCVVTDSAAVNDSTEIVPHQNNIFTWADTEEWSIIVEAISKDSQQINQAAEAADLDARMVFTPLAVEQLRMYFSQREYYEKFFKPLKILVTTNQMAWGVMAIKQKSALKIENNLKDVSSPYYLGKKYENLLDFTTEDIEGERFRRLTDEKNHYWSYLYGALYIKQLEAQWKSSGYPIDKRPEVVSTLYNLGFEKSKPKSYPEVGGSTLDIGSNNYTFGGLSFEIYYSGEMVEQFPYPDIDR